MLKVLLGIFFLLFCLSVSVYGFNAVAIQPRDGIRLTHKEDRIKKKELLGTLGAIGVQLTPQFIPLVETISEKCVLMKHFNPVAEIHYVAIPRKDIKDFADITNEDMPYIQECFGLLQEVIKANAMKEYRISSNGPHFQDIRILHFHLIGTSS